MKYSSTICSAWSNTRWSHALSNYLTKLHDVDIKIIKRDIKFYTKIKYLFLYVHIFSLSHIHVDSSKNFKKINQFYYTTIFKGNKTRKSKWKKQNDETEIRWTVFLLLLITFPLKQFGVINLYSFTLYVKYQKDWLLIFYFILWVVIRAVRTKHRPENLRWCCIKFLFYF